MSKNQKVKKTAGYLIGGLSGLSFLQAKKAAAGGEGGGGGGGGGGGWGVSEGTVTARDQYGNVSGTLAGDRSGFEAGMRDAAARSGTEVSFHDMGGGRVEATFSDGSSATFSGTSTPFLLTWNGEKFVHENDFLFGKPQSAFANYKIGLKKYNQGFGGDTYLLNNEFQADENGNLKFEIRELEPEESYIDRFVLNALDIKESEHFVVDGNLEDSYVFDTNSVSYAEEQKLYHYHNKRNSFSREESAYIGLVPKDGESLTLETDDELIIRLSKESLSADKDTYILVDSHYRDWSLGNEVPFSILERFSIQSMALSRNMVGLVTGATLALGAFFGTGVANNELSALEGLFKVKYSYADIACSGRDRSEGAMGCKPSVRGGRGGGRSLVISAGDSVNQVYLQTLFPRYVQASQEVVRIPKEIIAGLKEAFLTVRIHATKKHKVRATFVFQGEAKTPSFQPLKMLSALHSRDGLDYTNRLQYKNQDFLHTMPGDKVSLVFENRESEKGFVRRYVLKTNGFYTRLSSSSKAKIGRDWLDGLQPEDRKLLRRLRLT